ERHELDLLRAADEEAQGAVEPLEPQCVAQIAEDDRVGAGIAVGLGIVLHDAREVFRERRPRQQVAAPVAPPEQILAGDARGREDGVRVDRDAHLGELAHQDRAGPARRVGHERDIETAGGGLAERARRPRDQRPILIDPALQVDQERADPREDAHAEGPAVIVSYSVRSACVPSSPRPCASSAESSWWTSAAAGNGIPFARAVCSTIARSFCWCRIAKAGLKSRSIILRPSTSSAHEFAAPAVSAPCSASTGRPTFRAKASPSETATRLPATMIW